MKLLNDFLKNKREHFEIVDLNAFYDQAYDDAYDALVGPPAKRTWQDLLKKPIAPPLPARVPTWFVLEFNGDLQATQTRKLAKEISLVLRLAAPGIDTVVLKLKSPGGTVNGYGWAMAELMRLRDAGLNLVACVDEVAASGGYLMACQANLIVAAPYAIIGSIGVVMGFPNVHRFLDRHDVDYYERTAGESKRDVSVLGEITEENLERVDEKLQVTHEFFIEQVQARRPEVDPSNDLFNGDHWYGREALGMGLIDDIQTSEAYLTAAMAKARVVAVKYHPKRSLKQTLREETVKLFDGLLHARQTELLLKS